MWQQVPSLRALISVLVAVVFTVAVIPGAMAMPAPQHAMRHSMDSIAKAATHCDHVKPVKEQGSPCKNMQICMGMLDCFGMAAVVVPTLMPLVAMTDVRIPDLRRTLAGLTPPPDDRPPIA